MTVGVIDTVIVSDISYMMVSNTFGHTIHVVLIFMVLTFYSL